MYEAANVHLGEYTNESTNQKITCTDEEICHIDGEHEEPYIETIAIDEISEIRRDTDKSQTGFIRIGYVFAASALVFSVLAIQFLLAGVFSTIIAGGTAEKAVLSWYGGVMFYRMERGTLDVLEVRVNNEWYRFFTTKKETTFDEILARLSCDIVNRSTVTD